MLVVAGTGDSIVTPDTLTSLFDTAVDPMVLAFVRAGSHCWIDQPWAFPNSQCVDATGLPDPSILDPLIQ